MPEARRSIVKTLSGRRMEESIREQETEPNWDRPHLLLLFLSCLVDPVARNPEEWVSSRTYLRCRHACGAVEFVPTNSLTQIVRSGSLDPGYRGAAPVSLPRAFPLSAGQLRLWCWEREGGSRLWPRDPGVGYLMTGDHTSQQARLPTHGYLSLRLRPL